jgi:hypothetical protein
MNDYRNIKLRGKGKNVKMEIKGRERAQILLAEVAQKDLFVCYDGQVLRSMQELGNAFCAMTDETYTYHRNAKKKDFSKWVRDTIGDVKLARDLEKATSRSLAAWEVATRMAFLARQLP